MVSGTRQIPDRTKLPRGIAGLGPWALITGASDGIGAATALELAGKGFNLVLVARRTARLDALANEISATQDVDVQCISVDLGKAEGVTDLLQNLRATGVALSDIGVAALAAGYGTSGAFAETDIETERDMLRVNCDAVLHLSHVFTQSMKTRGAGHLVLLGSIVGFQGNAFTANYAATKAYVQSLAEGLAIEMAEHGVTVQSVAPGPVHTGFAARAGMTMDQAATPKVVARAIAKRLGRSGTIRPGLLSKVIGYSLALAPRFLRVRIISKIMSGMASSKSVNVEA